MRFGRFKFGSIQIDGVTYEHAVVIDGGSIRMRKKSRPNAFAVPTATRRSPLQRTFPGSAAGWWSGADGALPIMEEVEREAQARQVELLKVPTAQAIEELAKGASKRMPFCT